MNLDERIRLTFPHHLARVYEGVRLETEPVLQVQKLVDFYEEVQRTLALVRLATFDSLGLEDKGVQEARSNLGRPSMGHWMNLAEKLAGALQEEDRALAMPPLNRKHRDDAITEATETLFSVAGYEAPGTIRLSHFLSSVVAFRNKKIGHGHMTKAEARQVLEPLKTALEAWVGELEVLRERHLVHVSKVDYVQPVYRTIGTNLSSGSTLDPFHHDEPQGIRRGHVYLYMADGEEGPGRYVSLYPYFAFDEDARLLYVFQGLSNRGSALLRCPYEVTAEAMTIEVEGAVVLEGRGLETGGLETGELETEGAENEDSEREEDKVAPVDKDRSARGYGYMRNWFDIITPHQDIRQGNFDQNTFAASLGEVFRNRGEDVYRDAYLFFSKTYLTAGLRKLLNLVHERLTEGRGPAVVQVQTPFGGGKTHALVTLYHYLRNGSQVQALLPEGLPVVDANLVVIDGEHWNVLNGRMTEGVRRHTFWGELAYQLGGVEAYEQMRSNDESRISPGIEDLQKLLAQYQPFVLLFDEIVEYVNRAHDVRDELGVSLATQTYSFFQELTGAVGGQERGLMVVTLPLSKLEDFGEEEESALIKLGKIMGRREKIETPVEGEEVYAVIRRRLFDVETLKQRPMREVAQSYFQQYQQNKDDLPEKARNLNYRDRLENAYPFHPDLIDILFQRWSTFSSFQRTRGVLRLLASVVEDLYQREVNVDLILPGDVNLARSGIREEFLKHLGREYDGVIASDIAGHEAKAQALDQTNKQWKHLGERIAASIFLQSFAADDSEKGVSLPYIKLAVLRSNDYPAMVTDVLQKLSNALWYLNSRGENYYFSHIPNLNRMLLDKKELFNESYLETMEQIVKSEAGREFDTYVWPRNGDNVPDSQTLKLVILSPEDRSTDIQNWIERKGQSFREYKNTLFFALPELGAFSRLREEVKTHLALQEIKQQIEREPDSPLAAKKTEIQQRMHKIERDFSDRVRRMYNRVRFGERDIDLGQPVAGRESLGHWYWRELTSGDIGAIVEHLHYRLIVNRLMQGHEQLEIVKVLEQFYKSTQLPAPANPGVVARAIQLGVQDGAFGLAFADEEGEIKRESVRFEENVALNAITFEPGILLVERELARKLSVKPGPEVDYDRLLRESLQGEKQISTGEILERMRQHAEAPEAIDTDAVAQALQAAVDKGDIGLARLTNGEIEKEHLRFQEIVPLSAISFGERGLVLSKERVKEIRGGVEPPRPLPPDGKYERVRLVIADIPASRIADVNRGVFLPLSASVDGMTFTLEIDVRSEEGISKETLENKVKETIRQIGARVVEEQLE